MLNHDIPLTAEESAFAAEHHALIENCLRKDRLPVDEFYDIAVFGYLRAVHEYLASEDARRQTFCDYAEQAMRYDVQASKEFQTRLARKQRRTAQKSARYATDNGCRILNFPIQDCVLAA